MAADSDVWARVVCHEQWGCGKPTLTKAEYDAQMAYPDRTWRCPRCRGDAGFDDEFYENLHYPEAR